MLAARVLYQIGALRQAVELGRDAGVGEDLWLCALIAVSYAKVYTTPSALAEALEGLVSRRWPYAAVAARAAVLQLNSSGDLEEIHVPKAGLFPGRLGLVDESLVAASSTLGVPLVTYDMELWQYARTRTEVLTIYELCTGGL
ncbi:hypothetical protein TUZN_1159 [Thermoproteus uzoniensis 768-20]|uniref:PIN domain-containing protein n=1 Tax=Thermoproteus uzoniensis (strain 768-20) TaxID=999630 RepID=F2L0F6_THEU7|nr:hypothetical protein TUZN_1159 [Thermoproteus uzoniensis 768-20]